MLSTPGTFFRFKRLIVLSSSSIPGGFMLMLSSSETAYAEKSKVSSGSSAFSKPSKYSAHLWSLASSSLMMLSFASCIWETLLDDFPNKIHDTSFLVNISQAVTGGCRFKLISDLAVPGIPAVSQACSCMPNGHTVFIAEDWYNCLNLSNEISRFRGEPQVIQDAIDSGDMEVQWRLGEIKWKTLHQSGIRNTSSLNGSKGFSHHLSGKKKMIGQCSLSR